MKSYGLWIVVGVVFLFSLPSIVAQELFEPIDDLLVSLFQIFPLYAANPYPIDLILAIIFFGGLSSYILRERIGALAAWGLGIMLSVAFVYFEYFNKKSFILTLGPIALIIVLLLLGIMLFLNLQKLGMGSKLAFALVIPIVFGVVSTTFPKILDSIMGFSLGKIAFLLLLIFWFATVLSLLSSLIGYSKNSSTNSALNTGGGLALGGLKAAGRGLGFLGRLTGRGASALGKKSVQVLRDKLVERNLNKSEKEANALIKKLEETKELNEAEELKLLDRIINALGQVNSLANSKAELGSRIQDLLGRIIDALKELAKKLAETRNYVKLEFKALDKERTIDLLESKLEKHEDLIQQISNVGINTKEITAEAERIKLLQKELETLERKQKTLLENERVFIDQEIASIDKEINFCNELEKLLVEIAKGILSNPISTIPNIIDKLILLRQEIWTRTNSSQSLKRALDQDQQMTKKQEELNTKMEALEEQVTKYDFDSKRTLGSGEANLQN